MISSAAVNREGADPVRPYVDFYRKEEISPVDQVRTFSISTAEALDEFIDLIGAGTQVPSLNFKRFGKWFGQGQQYLSFIRTSGSTFTK